ncbi:MAG: hypothetical protein EB100_01170 [Crocinitomicaceae bacterium]|nr:hypothetical protein [Crocinitomicaceae bacterium]
MGLCTSKALVSLSAATMFILALSSFNWVDFKSELKKNRSFFFFLLFFIFYCLSTLWSSNLTAAAQDIVSKLTLVIIPLALIIKPIDSEWLKRLYTIFVWSVISTTIYNFIHYQFFTPSVKDIRALSYFISHIRFSLFISFTLGLLVKSINTSIHGWKRLLYVTCICWLLFYMYYSEVLSGILALTGGVLLCILVGLLNATKSKKWGYLLITIMLLMCGFFIYILLIKQPKPPHRIHPAYPNLTKLGNTYSHDTLSKEMENGNYIYTYICNKEIDSVWPLLSTTQLESENKNGYQTRMILYRYLTSKGLPKDAYGLKHLSSEDIRFIENGIPSMLENKRGIIPKINYYLKSLYLNENPNGNSFLQRLEYWRVGSTIFLKHPIIGVGIGDYKTSYSEEYKKSSSLLYPENQLETHQQFLSILITTGCIGGCLFVLLFYFFIRQKKENLLAIYFIGIILSSFLVEDTLTTLAGMSFFGIFYGIFVDSTITKSEINTLETVE